MSTLSEPPLSPPISLRPTGLALPPVSGGGVPPERLRELTDRVRELEEEREQLQARVGELECREGAIARVVDAVEAQRRQLVMVREEYEERRKALDVRGNELAQDRLHLRAAQAELNAAHADLEERERSLAEREEPRRATVDGSTLVEQPGPVTPARPPAPPRRPAASGPIEPDDRAWWAKQLGRPLEAA